MAVNAIICQWCVCAKELRQEALPDHDLDFLNSIWLLLQEVPDLHLYDAKVHMGEARSRAHAHATRPQCIGWGSVTTALRIVSVQPSSFPFLSTRVDLVG